VRVLIQENKITTKRTKRAISATQDPAVRAVRRVNLPVGNLKHAHSWLCCPLLHSSPPLTSWHVCNQGWRQETILPHSSPYNETVLVIPQQRERDGKTHLVEQYCEENLENQQHNPCNQASICGSALHKWRGILQRENDETEDEGYYLNDRGIDRDIDKERILFRWSRVGKRYSGDTWNREGLSTYCTPPGLRLIPLTKSQKNLR